MIYELRTYSLATGTTGKYLQLVRDVGREIRGDRYGTLEGAWTTEFGLAGQYVHLWSYADLNERERLRDELAKNERWTREYGPQIRPFLVAQENQILRQVEGVPLHRPDGEGHVYELRTYRMHVGKAAEWLGLFKEILPIRERYSKLVGIWTTEIGQLNRVVHLWVYDDLNQRADARARVAADPAWQAFLGKATALVAAPHSVILIPTETSPLR